MSAPAAPPLPPGRHVALPGRGRTFVRELPGPPGAPTVLLLHGWTASADLNWFPSYDALGEHFRVVALDHRGHGRGIRTRRRFRLADCADDAAALVTELGLGPVIVVGYSMGGPVAQLVWRRHPDVVAGLVLCATSRSFSIRGRERAHFAALATLAVASRAFPAPAARMIARRYLGAPPTGDGLDAWMHQEIHRSHWRSILEAGHELGRFDSRPWIGAVGVPAAVVVTTDDRLVPPDRQLGLARAIPNATVHPVHGRHTVCVGEPDRFVPVLVDACLSVSRRG